MEAAEKRDPEGPLAIDRPRGSRIDRDGDDGVPAPGATCRRKRCPVRLGHPDHAVEALDGLPLEAGELLRFPAQQRLRERIPRVRGQAFGNPEDRIVLIEDFEGNAGACGRVGSHPQLVGVHGVPGAAIDEPAEQLRHRRHLVAQDEERGVGEQAPQSVSQVDDPRTAKRDGLDAAAEPAKRAHVRLLVRRAHEAHQRHLVPGLRKMAEDVVGPDLRSCIERQGQQLREEENARHYSSLRQSRRTSALDRNSRRARPVIAGTGQASAHAPTFATVSAPSIARSA